MNQFKKLNNPPTPQPNGKIKRIHKPKMSIYMHAL